MKKLYFLAFIALVAFACSSSDKNGQSKTSTAAASTKVDGEKIYKTYCVTCHGVYGDMGASGAFNLTTSTLSLDERINVITNGRNAMTPFSNLLNEEKIKAVSEYIEKLRK